MSYINVHGNGIIQKIGKVGVGGGGGNRDKKNL